MRKIAAGVITMMAAACLIGCEGNNSKYQEINITKTDSKGYNLPIAQSDIDKAEKETEELLDHIERMYLPCLDDETPIPEDVQKNVEDVLAAKGYLVRAGEI